MLWLSAITFLVVSNRNDQQIIRILNVNFWYVLFVYFSLFSFNDNSVNCLLHAQNFSCCLRLDIIFHLRSRHRRRRRRNGIQLYISFVRICLFLFHSFCGNTSMNRNGFKVVRFYDMVFSKSMKMNSTPSSHHTKNKQIAREVSFFFLQSIKINKIIANIEYD